MNSETDAAAPVGVIDIGSNSIKCLVARMGRDGLIDNVYEQTLETRISRGIWGDNPVLAEVSIAAALESVGTLFAGMRAHGAERVRIVATSAVRDAANGSHFAEKVRAQTGVALEILCGDEEARLIGVGICQDRDLPFDPAQGFALTDLGGGSLELIDFGDGHVRARESFPLGAVRLTERFIGDPSLPLEARAAAELRAHVMETISASGIRLHPNLAATGGAVSVTRAIFTARGSGNSPVITRAALSSLARELSELALEDRKLTPALPHQRADIFPAALITLDAVMEYAGATEMVHSFCNLRFGIAAEMLAQAQD